jgi:pyridoxal biosynthesis lyase PdxS
MSSLTPQRTDGPVDLVQYVHENGKLTRRQLCRRRSRTPADAALMMQWSGGCICRLGIFKSEIGKARGRYRQGGCQF